MPHLGIDPGKQGAMVTLFEDGSLSFFDLKDLYDDSGASQSSVNPEKLGAWIDRRLAGIEGGVAVWCEKPIFVGAGFTIKTPMSMFESYGILRSTFVRANVAFYGVSPHVWQKWYPTLYHPHIKRTKEESVTEAKKIFPDYAEVFERVVEKGAHKGNRILMDGRAEAALIANYGKNRTKLSKN